jgi:hypothetical protein
MNVPAAGVRGPAAAVRPVGVLAKNLFFSICDIIFHKTKKTFLTRRTTKVRAA